MTYSDRLSAYKAFRENFDARRYPEAVSAGQQLVDMTEQQYGKDAIQLANPLTNLAVTQQRLKDFSPAEANYKRAIKIIETVDGGFSRSIIKPLQGLGLMYAAAGDYNASVESLRRAVDVSRKLDGLFNPNQLELMEPLINGYVAQHKLEDAEREQLYAMRLVEINYGKDDIRVLPALAIRAKWLEGTGRYTSARQLYARSVDIVHKSAGDSDLRMVEPLRGIARTYQLEFLYGPEVIESPHQVMGIPSMETPMIPANAASGSSVNAAANLNIDGEHALKLALKILAQHPDEAPALRGATIIDLADWELLDGNNRGAWSLYAEAWNTLKSAGAPGTAALETPVQLLYRAPSSTIRNPEVDPDEYEEHVVEVIMTVANDGRLSDVSLGSSDAPEGTAKLVVSAMKRARYRPRFVDGKPVETAGLHYRETVFTRK